MSLTRHIATVGVALVLIFTYASPGTEAYCFEVPGSSYNTPENCSSNCANFCTNITSCQNLTDPCDPNYPIDINHPCDPCDPYSYCRDRDFYTCGEIISYEIPPRHHHENTTIWDPCKRCSGPRGNETNFCLPVSGTPPPPPPVEPAPSFNYCSNPYSAGKCKQTIFSNRNSSCFCTYCI